MRTTMPKAEQITRKWYVVDAAAKSLGRLAVEVAKILRGKHKPLFARHLDIGDFVIVVNADKVRLSGRKAEEPIYWHTGYPGGIKSITRGKMLAKKPDQLIIRAVRGLLPHTTLGKHMLMKLKVYAGPEHPHEAQKPEPLALP